MRFFALREAESAPFNVLIQRRKNLLLRLGDRLVEEGLFTDREDIFFLTLEERQGVTAKNSRDWSAIVRTRRADRDRWLSLHVPDTIRVWEEASHEEAPPSEPPDGVLRGIRSPGRVSGPVRMCARRRGARS